MNFLPSMVSLIAAWGIPSSSSFRSCSILKLICDSLTWFFSPFLAIRCIDWNQPLPLTPAAVHLFSGFLTKRLLFTLRYQLPQGGVHLLCEFGLLGQHRGLQFLQFPAGKGGHSVG